MGTGFTPEQVAAILLRDGDLCAMSGHPENPDCWGKATTANHRLNRGAGGSKLRNGTGNGCGICNQCNGAIESVALLAALARHLGVKLRQGDDPERSLIWSPFFRQWANITDRALYLTGETDRNVRPSFEEMTADRRD